MPDQSVHQPRSSTLPPRAQAEADSSAGAQIASLLAEIRDLHAQIDQLRAERNTLADQQRRIQELLKAPSPDKIIHDLRNLLNERELLKALTNEL